MKYKVLFSILILILVLGAGVAAVWWYQPAILSMFFSKGLVVVAPPEEPQVAPAMPAENKGLIITDATVGEGFTMPENDHDIIKVTYIGSYGDGTTFDSVHATTPVLVDLSGTAVPVGWEVGLAGMRVGGTRIITILPEYAGRDAYPKLPKDKTIIYQVNLLSVIEGTHEGGTPHDVPPRDLPLVDPTFQN